MENRFLMLGDASFTVEFPTLTGIAGARKVRQLRNRIQSEIDGGHLDGIIDLVSATRSLTVCLDPSRMNFLEVRGAVEKLVQDPFVENTEAGEIWTLPVCYEGEYAPDLDEVAQRSKLSVNEVIQLHSSTVYDILFIGFLPGFPFLAELPEILRFPRRTSPRLRVPAGSVAIANDQTAIYPWESPGGWHLLGRCPVPLFNSTWAEPSLLTPGGQVSFEAVSEKDFKTLETDLTCGQLNPTSFRSVKRG